MTIIDNEQNNIQIDEKENNKNGWIVNHAIPLHDRKTYVYKIINTFDDKVYIGITCDPSSRWGDHKYCASKPDLHYNSLHLYSSMYKNKIENYKFEIIECLDNRALAKEREVYHIAKNKENGINVYNITLGGDTCPNHEENVIRNNEILFLFRTRKLTRADISKQFKMSRKHIGTIINLIMDVNEIKSIDDSLKEIISEKLSIGQNSQFRNEEIVNRLFELRKSINPNTNKNYTTSDIGNIFGVTRKRIETFTKSSENTRTYLSDELRKELCENFHNGAFTSRKMMIEKYNIDGTTVDGILDKYYEINSSLVRPKHKRISPKRISMGIIDAYSNGVNKVPGEKKRNRTPGEILTMCKLHHDRIICNKKQIADNFNFDYSTFIVHLKKYYENLKIEMPKDPRAKK